MPGKFHFFSKFFNDSMASTANVVVANTVTREKRFLRILVSILGILTFLGAAIWGFVDSARKSGSGYVALVGSKNIREIDFYESYDTQRKMIASQALSKSMVENLEKITFRNVVFNSMLEQEMGVYGFKFRDADIYKLVKNEIENGLTNEITITNLEKIRKQNGKEYKEFVARRKRLLFLKSILPAFTAQKASSNVWIKEVLGSRMEERVYDLYEVSPSKVGKTSTPTKEDLMSLYDVNIRLFELGNSYEVEYLDSEDLNINTSITDKELFDYYNSKFVRQIDRTKRDIILLSTKTEEDAKKALFLLKQNGNNFNTVTELMPSIEKKKLGKVGKLDLSDAIAEPVFTAPVGKKTGIIKSSNKFIIAMTEKVYSSQQGDMDATLRIKLSVSLKLKKRCEALNKIRDDIISSVSSGIANNNFLTDFAKKFDSSTKKRTIFEEKEDDVFRGDNLEKIKSLASKKGDKLSNRVDVIENKERCGFLALYVKEVNKGGKKSFASVIDELKNIWEAQSTDRLAFEIASDFAKRINQIYVKKLENQLLGNLLTSYKKVEYRGKRTSNRLDAERIESLHNNGHSIKNPVPKEIIDELFMVDVNTVVGPFKNDNGNYFIATLRKISPAKNADLAARTEEFLSDVAKQRSNDFLDLYESYLYSKYDVTVGENYKHLTNKG